MPELPCRQEVLAEKNIYFEAVIALIRATESIQSNSTNINHFTIWLLLLRKYFCKQNMSYVFNDGRDDDGDDENYDDDDDDVKWGESSVAKAG